MRARLAAVVVAVVAVCVLAGYLTLRASRDDVVGHTRTDTGAGTATVGLTYEATPDDTAPLTAAARTPLGTLHVAAYRRYDTASAKDGGEFVAPRGGTFVGVDTELDPSTSVVPSPTYQFTSPAQTALTTTLVAAGRRYPTDGNENEPIAVAGDASSLALDVTWDGVTQHVDLVSGKVTEGRAAALYTVAAPVTTPCGTPAIAGGYTASSLGLPLSCQVTWRRVPWLPRLGWAPGGRAWVVAAIATRGPLVLDRSGKGAEVSSSDSALTVRCGSSVALDVVSPVEDDPNPRQPAGHRRDGTSYAGCTAPAAGATGVTLAVTETLTLVDDGRTTRASWSVPLA